KLVSGGSMGGAVGLQRLTNRPMLAVTALKLERSSARNTVFRLGNIKARARSQHCPQPPGQTATGAYQPQEGLRENNGCATSIEPALDDARSRLWRDHERQRAHMMLHLRRLDVPRIDERYANVVGSQPFAQRLPVSHHSGLAGAVGRCV